MSEFKRIYGSKERVKFVKLLPCVGCKQRGSENWCENHHIEGEGLGRKAGFEKIVPLCFTCHRWLHENGRESFEKAFQVDLTAAAANTEKLWITHKTGDSE